MLFMRQFVLFSLPLGVRAVACDCATPSTLFFPIKLFALFLLLTFLIERLLERDGTSNHAHEIR